MNTPLNLLKKLVLLSLALTIISCQDSQLIDITTHLENSPKSFSDSFISGFGLIFISELGDRTFFMIMIYAATNSFIKTFLLSSVTMLLLNLISLSLGFALPFFLYRDLIDWVGILVFTVFGLKMLYDAYYMEDSLIEDELEEVQEELAKEAELESAAKKEDDEYDNLKVNLLENEKKKANFKSTWAFVSGLVIAEIGDKSQISAIVLGAINNFYGVLLGTSLAFLVCIVTSMLFGAMLAKKLTHKQLTICGGVMFLLFAIVYAFQKLYNY
jgi:putative Ca2+/H+ antiporter (TMEM165/GDT1 family)